MKRVLELIIIVLFIILLFTLSITKEPFGKVKWSENQEKTSLWLFTTIGWIVLVSMQSMNFTYLERVERASLPIVVGNALSIAVAGIALTRVMHPLISFPTVVALFVVVRFLTEKIRVNFK